MAGPRLPLAWAKCKYYRNQKGSRRASILTYTSQNDFLNRSHLIRVLGGCFRRLELYQEFDGVDFTSSGCGRKMKVQSAHWVNLKWGEPRDLYPILTGCKRENQKRTGEVLVSIGFRVRISDFRATQVEESA